MPMKPALFCLFVISLWILVSIETAPIALARPAHQFRVSASPLTPYRVIGVLRNITDSRVFVETASGVEHMIRIDGRTEILDQQGRAQSLRQAAALLRPGEVVTVELDQRDIVKSALRIVTPPAAMAKK